MSDALPFSLPLEGPRFRIDPIENAGEFRITRRSDDEPVGCISLRVEHNAIHIHKLAIHEPHRGFGAGSEAARLVLEAAQQNFPRVTAWAPPHLGLSVYFWFRMGLRPVPGEGPDGGLLFERTLPTK